MERKNIVMTGASRGLGLALSEALLREGYRVIGIGRSHSDGFRMLQTTNDSAFFESFDISHLEGIPGLVDRITESYGAIYGLVNNAGIGLDGLLATMHSRQISEVIRVNLEAPLILTKYACRSMLRNRSGRVVNISSIIASTGFSGLSVYAATKAGLEGFTRSLARELGRASITVNCIAPGYMKTSMTEGLPNDKLQQIARRAPLGLPEPQDITAALLYLLSSGASKTTGSTITVDGGSTA